MRQQTVCCNLGSWTKSSHQRTRAWHPCSCWCRACSSSVGMDPYHPQQAARPPTCSPWPLVTPPGLRWRMASRSADARCRTSNTPGPWGALLPHTSHRSHARLRLVRDRRARDGDQPVDERQGRTARPAAPVDVRPGRGEERARLCARPAPRARSASPPPATATAAPHPNPHTPSPTLTLTLTLTLTPSRRRLRHPDNEEPLGGLLHRAHARRR